MVLENNSNWYVIWTQSGKEYDIKTKLEAFVPEELYERVVIPYKLMPKRLAGQWFTTKVKLFNGYVFVVTDDPEKIVPYLKEIIDFTDFLKMDERIVPIYKEEENFLLSLMGEKEEVEMSRGIIEGDKIRVISGPLVGQEAHIKRIDRHKRKALIETELLGRGVEVTVGLEVIDKI